jgi:hypothetical protein
MALGMRMRERLKWLNITPLIFLSHSVTARVVHGDQLSPPYDFNVTYIFVFNNTLNQIKFYKKKRHFN